MKSNDQFGVTMRTGNRKTSSLAWHLAAAFVLVGVVGAAHALPTINLTGSTYNNVPSTPNGTITTSQGTVTFTNQAFQPTGTGVFNPFLRLDVKGNLADEQGYNTSATISEGPTNNQTTRKVLDNMSPVNWTHDVKISDLQLTADGNFYQFKLDINEPGNANSLLSLDGLKLFATNVTSQSGEALDGNDDIKNSTTGIQGDLLWDMDEGKSAPNGALGSGDRSVLLDAKLDKGPGSGVSDMVMLVPKGIIDGSGKTHLILWSRFGLEQAANTGLTTADAGFEEWAFSAKSGTTVNPGGGAGVPIPGTAALSLLGLALVGRKTRRKALSTSTR